MVEISELISEFLGYNRKQTTSCLQEYKGLLKRLKNAYFPLSTVLFSPKARVGEGITLASILLR